MTTLKTPSETIAMRDALAEWLNKNMLLDYRITIQHDSELIGFDFADDLIRAGWVITAPEAKEEV